MKGKTRNIYPGGNTTKGFFSYYNDILSQRKAEKIFCIKGGPGVGKSTLMKSVAGYFTEKGEDVDFLWCSSDPDSLDGVLLKKRAVAIIDGTAPHIIDPKNPGAVDEIVNLGDFWNEEKIRICKEQIIACNEQTANAFAMAYVYLRCAAVHYEKLEQVMDNIVTPEQERDIKRQIKEHLPIETSLKCGTIKRAFATAITPKGLKNQIMSIIGAAEKIVILESPVGFKTEKILIPVLEKLSEAGFDTEAYYCPMNPDKRLEHIFCREASLAVVTCNSFHDIKKRIKGRKHCVIKVAPEENGDSEFYNMAEDLQKEISKNISKALMYLEKAKTYHDRLEGYYVPHMDFKEVGKIRDNIIEKIEML